MGLVLALLVAVANGDMFERADAVHAVLMWRSNNRGVTDSVTTLYIAALKVKGASSGNHITVKQRHLFIGIYHTKWVPACCGPLPATGGSRKGCLKAG